MQTHPGRRETAAPGDATQAAAPDRRAGAILAAAGIDEAGGHVLSEEHALSIV
jgi:hypothetical protein